MSCKEHSDVNVYGTAGQRGCIDCTEPQKSEPNNLEWLDEILQDLSALIAISHVGKGIGYEEKRKNDDIRVNEAKLAITAKISEIETQARIDELLRLTRFKMIKTNTGTTDQRIVERLRELRKRKDEVLK